MSDRCSEEMGVIRDQEEQIKCPLCGSENTARYIYGYPDYNEEMQKKLDEGKWVLGGCCLECVEVNGRQVSIRPAGVTVHGSKVAKTISKNVSEKCEKKIEMAVIETILGWHGGSFDGKKQR